MTAEKLYFAKCEQSTLEPNEKDGKIKFKRSLPDQMI